ncbi:hypothetical protein C8R42DRAFT_719541 [Lentinula raphanica]|nr:hypothetical protein C8R42DRAFT_719541 [Lentinula raphanica]
MSEPNAVSVDGPVTMLPLESPGLQPSGSLTSDVFTLSTPGLGLPSILPSSASNSSSSTNHGGAIAGGVIAAVIATVVVAVLLLRHRNKRSPRHWRNRMQNGVVRPFPDNSNWQTLDSKSNLHDRTSNQTLHPNFVLDDHNSPITSPATAKFSTPLMTYPPGALHLSNNEKGK